MEARDGTKRRHLVGLACATAMIASLLGPAQALAGGSLSANPPSLSFGSQTVITNESLQVQMDNTSPSGVMVTSVSVSGADSSLFTPDGGCDGGNGDLPGFGSCTINVSFFPTTTGAKTASLDVQNSGSPNLITVPLSGTGVEAAMTLAPAMFDFGSVVAGSQSAPHSFTAIGDGAGKVTIQDVSITGANASEFVRTGGTCFLTPPFRLATSESCTVDIALAPTSSGAKAATLEFMTNAPDSPDTAALTGTATSTPTVVAPIPLLPTTVPTTPPPKRCKKGFKLKRGKCVRKKRKRN